MYCFKFLRSLPLNPTKISEGSPAWHAYKDLMRLRQKGCFGQGMEAGLVGGVSPISAATSAAVDHAFTKSALPLCAANEAFWEQISSTLFPDRLYQNRRWKMARQEKHKKHCIRTHNYRLQTNTR